MEVMGAWREHYRRAAYIDMGIVAPGTCRARAVDEANRRGWEFADLQGDQTLIRRLLEGQWDDQDFLVVPPGQQVAATYDESVMAAREIGLLEG